MTERDLAIDRELSEISGLLPILRYTTPINLAEARDAFFDDRGEPSFVYRPLPDLSEVSRRLDAVDVDAAVDPVVAHMARDKKRELEIGLDLLLSRGTDDFFLASVELFGHVEKPMLELAHDLLELTESSGGSETVSAEDFAAVARTEIGFYRRTYPELDSTVHVDPQTAGVVVEHGDLFIGADMRVALDRVEQLVHHEVGVHVLTYANGSVQPLRMLAVGLAGYSENQEALGMLAEHLSGGLPTSRLHTLARRVVAAHLRSQQATFAETVQRLLDLGAGPRAAFMTSMRAHRAGGMTKDAIYLRGLVRLCEHLAKGGNLDRLFVGKITLEDEPLVEELIGREVLCAPVLLPRFLTTDIACRRLEEIRGGKDVRDLGGIAA
ncbi:MAG TPA: tyrosine/phenylalanine carboxypeptidase domain-containing protein [Euzebya sp.]|nr:tyrosine/phenylalanine carboxypeptidase domain-containing protein [Euzebya sp.]